MEKVSSPNRHRRLASLDILRGADMFLLVFLQPVILAFAQCGHPQWLEPLLYQLDHEVWEGFRCWDLVMPLFLFMTGAAMPFSFSKYRGAKRDIYRKVARRVAILFLLGMIVQGNLLGFDPGNIFIYTNTLQAIAAGYLISAVLLLHLGLRGQIAATAALLVIYSLPMALWGDYSCGGNFADAVDALVLGRFRGDPSYTWVWSSLTFGVTVMLGAFATTLIRRSPSPSAATALRLLAMGLALTAAGYLWSFQQPVIKRLWTSSMTLISGGYCTLLLALFYYIIDVKGKSLGLEWLKIYGTNSIAAYIMGEVINFRSIVDSLSYGLARYMGNYYEAWLTLGNFTIIFLILLFMYRRGIFLKI